MESEQIVCTAVDETLWKNGKGYLVNVLGAVFVWVPCFLIFIYELWKELALVDGGGDLVWLVFPLGIVFFSLLGVVSGVQTYFYSFVTVQGLSLADVLTVKFYSGHFRSVSLMDIAYIRKFSVNKLMCWSLLINRRDYNYLIKLTSGKVLYLRGNVGDVDKCIDLLQKKGVCTTQKS